ncbi:hypothetical protein LEMLEM_LOCUS25422, partial [Lemmus lemmus]
MQTFFVRLKKISPKNHKVKEENSKAPTNSFKASNRQKSQHKGRKKDSARRGSLGCVFVCLLLSVCMKKSKVA